MYSGHPKENQLRYAVLAAILPEKYDRLFNLARPGINSGITQDRKSCSDHKRVFQNRPYYRHRLKPIGHLQKAILRLKRQQSHQLSFKSQRYCRSGWKKAD